MTPIRRRLVFVLAWIALILSAGLVALNCWLVWEISYRGPCWKSASACPSVAWLVSLIMLTIALSLTTANMWRKQLCVSGIMSLATALALFCAGTFGLRYVADQGRRSFQAEMNYKTLLGEARVILRQIADGTIHLDPGGQVPEPSWAVFPNFARLRPMEVWIDGSTLRIDASQYENMEAAEDGGIWNLKRNDGSVISSSP
jgi:hypothetical protein